MTTTPSDNSFAFRLLPHLEIEHISGFLEALLERGGEESLSTAARRLFLTVDELIPILEAIKLLGFGRVSEAIICVTDLGRVFADTTIPGRRWLFRQQVLENIPQIAFMTSALQHAHDFEEEADYFLEKFKEGFPGIEAEQQFAVAVEWGRYAELFEYDADTKRLHLLPINA